MSTTTNRNQETVRQETDSVVDVAQGLENFGIAKSAVAKLIQSYPAAYIWEKLAMAQGLVAAGSCLVSQNPAGWLRKAIEEDYSPSRTPARHRQQHFRGKKDRKPVNAEPREPQIPEKESQRVQNVATEQKEDIPENKELEKTSRAESGSPTSSDTVRENETVWNKTLEKLQADLLLGEAERQLKGTTLLQVTDTAARIGVPSAFAIAWLERRMYGQIASAIKGVLGKDLDLQFIAAS